MVKINIIRNGLKEKNKIKQNSNITHRIFGILAIFIITTIFIIPYVMAHCPLCTGATIIGVGITRSLGWDDSIVGVFVGAMIISSALWMNNIFKKRNIGGNALLRITSITIATLVLTFLTFYYAGLFGLGNTYRIFGIEKIVFGAISGSFVSIIGFAASNKIKAKNDGKAVFGYQTMIITFAGLILNALVFWIIFK